MKLDLQTLAFILSLTCIAQVIALFIQYKVNKTYQGIEWWLLGSLMMAMGFISLSLATINSIGRIAALGNPLLILGRACLLIGTLRFVGRKEHKQILIFSLTAFICIYYYYLFGYKNISGRIIIVSTAISIFSIITSYVLFSGVKRGFSGAAKFTGSIFLLHGLYLIVVVLFTIFSKPIQTYFDFAPIQMAAFIVPTLTSTLWTFGFILMINQRLSSDNLEEKENLQRVFSTSPDASAITRLEDGLFVDINLGFSAISGYSRSEIIGKSSLEFNLWQDPGDRDLFVSDLDSRGSSENREFIFKRKDGSQFVGMTSAKTISMSGIPHVMTVIRDITGRKRAEEALRESEETYRSILKASPDDITITDLKGRILMVSPAANVMFGYELGEGDGLRIHDFILPEDVDRAEANIKRMYLGAHAGPNEYRGVRKDGSVFDIEVNSGFIRGLNGQPIKMVFMVRDISERKQAEAERSRLEAQNHQLQKAESLGRMAGAIAHHFNNKLQSVMANLELLGGLSKAMDPSRYLTMAKQATEGAAAVSRLMLVYLGQASDNRDPQHLSHVFQEVTPRIQGTLRGTTTLEADWPSTGPVASVNADQIQQVLTNLVDNAREALGDAGGCIHMGLDTCSAAKVPSAHRFPIDWQPQAVDYACLHVKDEGPGIPEADLEKLFDPFYSTKFSGRGLGLPVVLGIVQAHGGCVVVGSELGHGSVFRVYLPISTEPVPRPAEPAIPALEPLQGESVLLVDDDEFLLSATGAMIEMLGFKVLTALDGVEAVEVYQRHMADIRLVVTDLTMPRMDGWETLAALRQLNPTLPVILSSGYDKAQIMAQPHAVRPQGFLGKPYTLQQLREALVVARYPGAGSEPQSVKGIPGAPLLPLATVPE